MRAEGTALVTGASRGIGRALTVELATRGFDVIAGMRDPVAGADLTADEERLRGTIRAAQLDVTDAARFEFPGRLSVLVNNAGIEFENLSVEDTPLDRWRQMFETNVFGLVDVTRRVIPALREAGAGVVCNITSASLLVPMPFFAVYRASKAAVGAFGESLAIELAPHAIRVLEVMPGPIGTDMLAASSIVPEAASEPYQALAEQVGVIRSNSGEATPPAEAARLIVDSILDDGAPLRVSCDPLGSLLIEGWRGQTDEQAMAEYLEVFSVGG